VCGIAGIVQLSGEGPGPDRGLLHRMNQAQIHRGPDEGGIYLDGAVGLGHRRLSIIDRADGQQPLFNEDGSVVVVFNGEIYNFRSLRDQLIQRGHRFRTRSDTEVIVHAWEQWGEDCVSHFRGMFAFAIWDQKQKLLFLARDRLGIKPLFYSRLASGELIFASELKALREHPGFDSSLDHLAIEEYFGFGYVPDPRSIYANTRKLPPGHVLSMRLPCRQLPDPDRYWDVPFGSVREEPDEVALEALRSWLDEAVDVRLVSEVPLGAFLSGGVDSSSVVAAMAGRNTAPVNTCSMAFGEPGFDESDYAAEVSRTYQTRHFVEHVDCEDYSLLDQLAGIYDEPFADSSALPTYRVCQLAKKHVTVVLSGDGGDEVLAGYRRYGQHIEDLAAKQAIPSALGGLLSGIGRVYPDKGWMPPILRRRQGLLGLGQDPVTSFFEINSVMKNDLRQRLYRKAFLDGLQGYRADQVCHRHAKACGSTDPLAMAQYLDIKTYLPGDILTKVDRASMAHALEVRVPLLDHKLVEWAANLPAAQKRRGGEGKWLLKKAMEGKLPDKILYRPKRGFAVPLGSWFRGPLRQRVEQTVEGDVLLDAGVFERRALREMWQRHLGGGEDYAPQIWSVLMFESFLRRLAS